MREAYKEVMEHVVLTEDMRARILRNIQNIEGLAPKAKLVSFPARWFAAAACAALLLAGAIAIPKLQTPTQSENPSGVQNGILDRREASSLRELEQLVGFEVEGLEHLPFEVTEIRYMAYGTALAEVNYVGEDQTLVFRKTAGSTDPSGDYTAYPDTLVLELGSCTVTLKGESGMYRLAVWQDQGYSCSANASEAFSPETWGELLEGTGG